jgi:hypothetical protein
MDSGRDGILGETIGPAILVGHLSIYAAVKSATDFTLGSSTH